MNETHQQNSSMPLLFVDVDEVVLEHLPHLKRALSARGFDVLKPIHELSGDVVETSSGRSLSQDEIKELTDECFVDITVEQTEIPDASTVLNILKRDFEIHLLTNFPERHSELRHHRLNELDINFPIIFNSGGKGSVLSSMASCANAPVLFVDDSISQIVNAKKHLSKIKCIHFAYMDHVFEKYQSHNPAEFQVRSWFELLSCIRSNFMK